MGKQKIYKKKKLKFMKKYNHELFEVLEALLLQSVTLE